MPASALFKNLYADARKSLFGVINLSSFSFSFSCRLYFRTVLRISNSLRRYCPKSAYRICEHWALPRREIRFCYFNRRVNRIAESEGKFLRPHGKQQSRNLRIALFSASLKCLPSPIGVILDIFILNSPKHGSSLPAPNGSSNSRLFIKSIFMYAGFNLQSSLSSGNGISTVFAYSFIAVRNSSILLFRHRDLRREYDRRSGSMCRKRRRVHHISKSPLYCGTSPCPSHRPRK